MKEINLQTDDPVIRRLQGLSGKYPALANVTNIYAAIIPLLRDADNIAGPVSLTSDQVREKIQRGQYLLSELELNIDIAAFRKLVIELAGAVESFSFEGSTLKSKAARHIRLALEGDMFDLNGFISSFTVSNSDHLFQIADGPEFDRELLTALFKNAIRPSLRSWCSTLSASAADLSWQKGYCYVCGATASISEIQGHDQEMHLRCASCGGDWKFNRLRCIYCDNDDHKTQKFLSTEGESDLIRLELCDKCMGYIKVFNSYEPSSAEMVMVKDLETLHLDFIAHNRGYTRHVCR